VFIADLGLTRKARPVAVAGAVEGDDEVVDGL
jgi:hypothetical protein